MKILVAPDKFKGSLTAVEAAQYIAAGWKEGWPECKMIVRPVADGGDGTLETIKAASGGEWKNSPARDARRRLRDVRWLWQPTTETAWLEIARVCGLASLQPHERSPLDATTAGVGELIASSVASGARRIVLCLGGSATNDAGCGMAAALGFTFEDATGGPFDPIPLALPRLAAIKCPKTRLSAEITALTDVRNPLLGPNGASHVYGPQKGAAPHDVELLENALAHVTKIAVRSGLDASPLTPGAGAAGGLGYGIMAFLGGRLAPGFDTIAALTNLPAEVAGADIVITGEGCIDGQTSAGKAPAGVAHLARRHGKPAIAFAGSIPLNNASQAGFDAMFQITDDTMTHEFAMQNAGALLQAAAARAADAARKGKILS